MGTVLGAAASVERRGVVTIPPESLESTLEDLESFLQPYLPLFGREERRVLAARAVRGLLSSLPRKSAEPLAYFFDQPRRAMQRFVGAGEWDDGLILDQVCGEVAQELGSVDGVFIVDKTAFAKKGDKSVGVARQWSGRLGKIDNCQTGVFLTYASRKGHTLVDRRLYLPEAWAKDKARRELCHVPKDVVFCTSWELADELIMSRAATLPHSWIVGDEEFGRPGEFRDRLMDRGEKYMLEVPSDLHIVDLWQRPHPGRRPDPAEAREWADSQPPKNWKLFTVRNTTKGPLQVRAAWTRVMTNRKPGTKKGDWSREEVLLVIQTLGQRPETKYFLTTAGDTTLAERVQVACTRWKIEDTFERAKQEVGLAQYEVRSWTGWHHHMTLGLLALWFLTLQHLRLRPAFPPSDRLPDAAVRGRTPRRTTPEADPGSHRRASEPSTHTERTSPAAPPRSRSRTAQSDVDRKSLVGGVLLEDGI
jgi:SRSO17 transposase